MLRLWILTALVVGGCDKGQEHALRWKLPKGESLAYRVSAEARAVVDGQDQGTQEISGYVFVDVDGDGRATIHLDTAQPIFGITSMELAPGESNYLFPLPEKPLAKEPVVQSVTIEGQGTTSTQTNPDIEVSETLTKTAADGSLVSVAFSRKGKPAGATPLEAELEEEGQATFDVKEGRYQRLERTVKMTMSSEFGGENTNMSVTGRLALDFDAERSKSRTEERAQLRKPPVSPEELAEYVEAHPVDEEIAAAVQPSGDTMPSPLLWFHLRANPVATWKQAMELPANEPEAFVSVVSFHLGRGPRLPQVLVDWLRAELPKQPALEEALINMPDERLREQLLALAARSGPENEKIASQARDALEVLDAQKAGPSALLAAGEADFMTIGDALMAEGQDHRALVPVLIEILERSVNSSPTSKVPLDDISVQWLEALASRSFGKDVKAWKQFWDANKNRPYCQWMIDAAGQDTPLLVNNALSKLSACHESDEATEYLATRVQTGTGDARHVAAMSLAEHKDPRAIPALIDMLANDNQQLRAMALWALANFHNTTLGYDPAGDDASRAAALRRWRAWANRPD